NSHTANFLADQLNEVITEVGAENFAAVVSDHTSACAAAKKRIAERYKHILPIRFKYFKQSHQAGEELRSKITNDIKGDVEAVNTLLGPVKSVVKSLEFKTTTLADCFVELIKLTQKIKSLPPVSDYDFKYQCVELFNKRWQEFDIQLYLLAYLLHPHYKGIGLRLTILRNIQSFYLKKEEYNIPYSAGRGDVFTWWILCNPVRSEENHIQKLALKILAITPHNAGCERVFSVLGWFANQRRSRLKVEKLEAMAKLHTHYITNAQKELKYAYVEVLSEANASDGLDKDEGNDFFDDDDDDDDDGDGDGDDGEDDYDDGNDNNNDDDDDDDDDEESSHDSNIPNQRDTEIEKWVNINDLELKKLLNIEVNVVIEPHPLPVINHGSNVFDVEATRFQFVGIDMISNWKLTLKTGSDWELEYEFGLELRIRDE
ncbi:hypothetical protein RhiirA5_423939, partial [Rhizophagus irregularis]